MIGTNLGEQAATSDMDKLMTLMAVVNDPDRVNKALVDLKQAKSEADAALYDLKLGKAAKVALAEAHALNDTLNRKITETEASAAALIDIARSEARTITDDAIAIADRTMRAGKSADIKLAEAEKALAAAKIAREAADESRLAADEAVAEAVASKEALDSRLKEINARVAAL